MRDVLRVGSERRYLPCNTVIEPGADSNQKVAIFDCIICICGAMHAEHMKGKRVRRIE